MPDTPCTICSTPTASDDVCPDCETANFPPPQDIPVPWWQAVRMQLAPNRDGIRAMYRGEEPAP